MNNYPSEERRRFKRVKVGVNVFYRESEPPRVLISNAEGVENEASMVDVSEGGMAIVSSVSVPPATLLRVRFTLSYTNDKIVNYYGNMELLGEVRSCVSWQNKLYRLGISFISLDNKTKDDLSNFVVTMEKDLEKKP